MCGGLSGCGGASLDMPAELPHDGNPEIAEILEPIVREHHLPALAGAILTSDGLEAASAVGFRKWGEDTAVTVGDLWHLGSETKAITAVLVGRLVERRRIRWDTRVDEVFPDLADDFHADCRGITVEHLLTHRAGLVPNLNWAQLSRDGGVRQQREAATQEALAKRPRHEPGTHFEYSNLGYVVVGAMLERIMDQPWEELIEEQVFEPLKMTDVGHGGMGTPGELNQPWGHKAPGKPVFGNGPSIDNPPVLGPAGRVHASLASWALFIADQLRGARGESGLLQAETYKRIHQPPAGGDYALGWAVTERDWGGGTVLTHSGCNTMHFSVAWVAPLKAFAVLVCCNQGDDTAAKAADQAAGALIRWHLEKSNQL
jgi:CubicO group peptidase (beta-lactamase class C family)